MANGLSPYLNAFGQLARPAPYSAWTQYGMGPEALFFDPALLTAPPPPPPPPAPPIPTAPPPVLHDGGGNGSQTARREPDVPNKSFGAIKGPLKAFGLGGPIGLMGYGVKGFADQAFGGPPGLGPVSPDTFSGAPTGFGISRGGTPGPGANSASSPSSHASTGPTSRSGRGNGGGGSGNGGGGHGGANGGGAGPSGKSGKGGRRK